MSSVACDNVIEELWWQATSLRPQGREPQQLESGRGNWTVCARAEVEDGSRLRHSFYLGPTSYILSRIFRPTIAI